MTVVTVVQILGMPECSSGGPRSMDSKWITAAQNQGNVETKQLAGLR